MHSYTEDTLQLDFVLSNFLVSLRLYWCHHVNTCPSLLMLVTFPLLLSSKGGVCFL